LGVNGTRLAASPRGRPTHEPLAEVLGQHTPLEPALAGLIARLVSIAVTLGLILIAYRVLLRVVARLLAGHDGDLERGQRYRTVGPLLTNVIHWVIAFIALVIVLREFGIDVQALLVSAGVIGLAVGLGAQTLIKDVITGFFLLFEGLIGVGDIVEIGARSGTVEAIGLRVTRLRTRDGALHIIPNGQLTEFSNFTRGWAQAMVDVGLPHDVKVDRALAVLDRVGEDWARDTGAALAPPQTEGIVDFKGNTMVLRLVVKVDPTRRFETEADLRRRIKEAFDREAWAPVGA